jgi:hypothetical protein
MQSNSPSSKRAIHLSWVGPSKVVLGPSHQDIHLEDLQSQTLFGAQSLQVLANRALALDAGEEVRHAKGPLARPRLQDRRPAFQSRRIHLLVTCVVARVSLPNPVVESRLGVREKAVHLG